MLVRVIISMREPPSKLRKALRKLLYLELAFAPKISMNKFAEAW